MHCGCGDAEGQRPCPWCYCGMLFWRRGTRVLCVAVGARGLDVRVRAEVRMVRVQVRRSLRMNRACGVRI